MTPKNRHQSLSLTLLLILGLLLTFSPSVINICKAIDVTPNTRVGLHDVVHVNYTMWAEKTVVDGEEGIVYVENPDIIEKEGVPESIFTDYPAIFAPPNVGFQKALIGMKAGEIKNVTIEGSEGFTNASDPYVIQIREEHGINIYRKELYYEIRLKEILLDASTPTVTLMDLPFFIPLVILLSLLIFILIILRIQRYSRTHNLFSIRTKCYSCQSNVADVMCGNVGCNTLYCKTCFLKNNRCEVCHINTMVPRK